MEALNILGKIPVEIIIFITCAIGNNNKSLHRFTILFATLSLVLLLVFSSKFIRLSASIFD